MTSEEAVELVQIYAAARGVTLGKSEIINEPSDKTDFFVIRMTEKENAFDGMRTFEVHSLKKKVLWKNIPGWMNLFLRLRNITRPPARIS